MAKKSKSSVVLSLSKPKASVKATGVFAKKVQKVLNSQLENKYIAENVLSPAVAVPQFQATPLNLARIFPRMGQGSGDNQRIGDHVTPRRATAFFTIFPADTTLNLYDITVNLVIVRVKGASTDTAVGAIPGGDFLKVGDGTNTDPAGYTPEQMLTLINRYPVNPERYTVLKHYRRRFCKGPNNINGPVGVANASPTAGTPAPAVLFKYSWKPPVLKYDNGAATLPTNHYPTYLIWATANDASAYVGNVKFSLRTEMYYKDG